MLSRHPSASSPAEPEHDRRRPPGHDAVAPLRRVHVARTAVLELVWIELERGCERQLELVCTPAIAVALTPVEVAWRGTLARLEAGEAHVSRAGELCVFRPLEEPARLAIAHLAQASAADLGPALDSLLADASAVAPRELSTALERTLARVASSDLDHSIERQPQALELGPVRRARLHIEASFADMPTLADLASISGISRFHLARAFRAYHAVPPHVYLNCVRIAHARALLTRDLPAVEVAAQLGFVDQSHFTHRFHDIVGLTPSSFARASAAPRA